MSKQDVYRAHKIDKAQIPQIRGFTAQSMRGIYQGRIRQHLRALGYRDRRIQLADPGALQEIDRQAGKIARSIVKTYNRMLRHQLRDMPSDLPDHEYRRMLRPFFAAADAYNHKTLIPFANAWTQQRATERFFRKNAISATWEWSGGDALDSMCSAIRNASPMDAATAAMYAGTIPVHRNCQCRVTPTSIDTSTLPAVGTEWDGQ